MAEKGDILFRVWTGKKWYYQDDQYLGSFIRRAVEQIVMDTTGEFSTGHESYLPNGGDIEEYLYRYIGLRDENKTRIYEGDILIVDPDPTDKHGGYDVIVRDMNEFLEEKGYRNGELGTWNEFEVVGNIKQNPELFGANA